MMPRWYVNFNMTLLRMLSFGMDYHWSLGAEKGTGYREDPDNVKHRIEAPRKHDDYNFINYLTYCLYIPLYLAGPIITFNDFHCQVRMQRLNHRVFLIIT